MDYETIIRKTLVKWDALGVFPLFLETTHMDSPTHYLEDHPT